MEVRREWLATALWAGAAGVVALVFIYSMSFPYLGWTAPLLLGGLMFGWLDRHASVGRALHGVVLGAAVLPGWVAWYHRDYQACPASAADMADGAWHCGGTNPLPFAVGAGLLALAFVAIWIVAGPSHGSERGLAEPRP